MHKSWYDKLQSEFKEDYFINLMSFLKEERKQYNIYPSSKNLWNAFETPFDKISVVILGQDPYHGPGQAHGLSFSVQIGIKPPPSLQNIFKELNSDLNIPIPNHGCLESWAKQGVFLLNTIFSVREGQPKSHQGKGWERFTDKVIQLISNKEQPIVFMLWGSEARAKKHLINNNHLIIQSPHPSPFSAYNGFFGSKPFSKANEFLKGRKVNWDLTFGE